MEQRAWIGADAIAGLLATATAYAYGTVGLGALGLLAVVQLTYQYLASNLLISQRRAEKLGDLSAARGRLVGQVLRAEENERRRLAEALHHDALQDLVFAQGLAASSNCKAGELGAAIGRAVEQLRAAIMDLHPAVLKHAGLAAALYEVADQHAQRNGDKPTVKVEPDACGPHDQLLFVLAREQLTNAAKHADATEVALSIGREDGKVVMNVTDNGCGMDAERRRTALEQGHIGLASSAERVEALGGNLEIESQPGEGTRIRTTLPIDGV